MFAIPELGAGRRSAEAGEPTQFMAPELESLGEIDLRLQRSTDASGRETESVPSLDADSIIENARREAARIIADADSSAAEFARAAEERAVGEMQAKIEVEVAEKVAGMRDELAATISQVSALSQIIAARHENDLVELAIAIAKKIVAREVTIDREIAFTLVKVSLAKLHDRAVAEVHLNPEDLAYVESQRERVEFRGALELIADKSVTVGGCLIHTDAGEIDGRIESQFEEIAHGLLQ
jgi:flagellar assembly protein FliH